MLMIAACFILLMAAGAGAQDLAGAQAEAQKALAAFNRTPQAQIVLNPAKIGPSLRSPTWELGALIASDAGGGASSKLTDSEKTIARGVYGDAIELESVRVVYAPSPTGYPMTWGDTIRMPPNRSLSTGTLIHELAHVWQYQTRGTSYISDSMLKQTCAVLTGHDRDKAYEYAITDGKSLLEYSAEQQAEIIEDYAVSKTKHADPRYQALIDQMRKMKAVKDHVDLFLERDFGLQPRNQAPPVGWDTPFNGEAGRVPQVEIRF